ncbi:MAG: hypothetical protein HY757_07050 [Nitrospirae bacterium]|nr:hypothetical protein [Nitrospirota bacterium]
MSDLKKSSGQARLASRELFQMAQRLFVEGKHRESIDYYTEFMKVRGKTEIALLSRGVAYLKTDQADKAIDDFGMVIDMNSQNVRAYLYRGTAYMVKLDFESAIKDFNITINLKPDLGAAFFARGSAYAQIGYKYEAARDIKTAIIISKSNINIFTDICEINRNQLDKAIAVMEEKEPAPNILLTEDEINTVKKWLEECDH